MITKIISTLLILLGSIFISLELLLSLNIFKYSGSAGVGLVLFGVFIFSYKGTKQKHEVSKKDLGNFPDVGGCGGD